MVGVQGVGEVQGVFRFPCCISVITHKVGCRRRSDRKTCQMLRSSKAKLSSLNLILQTMAILMIFEERSKVKKSILQEVVQHMVKSWCSEVRKLDAINEYLSSSYLPGTILIIGAIVVTYIGETSALMVLTFQLWTGETNDNNTQKDIFQIILDSDKCDEENKIGQ